MAHLFHFVTAPHRKIQSANSPTVPRLSCILLISIGLSIGCFLSAAMYTSSVLEQSLSFRVAICSLAFFSFFLGILLSKYSILTRQRAMLLTILPTSMIIGAFWHSPRLPNSSLPPAQSDYSSWIVEIASLPKRTTKNYKYQIHTILFCNPNDTPTRWDTNALLYLNAADSSAGALQPGDIMILTSPITPFKKSDSISPFDFSSWARTHGIAGTAFASSRTLFPLHARNNSLRYKNLRVHGKIIQKFRSLGIEQPELGPIVAMTLGERSELSADINQHFRNSGLAHILAISGFHVGIIFLVFQCLTKPLITRSFYSSIVRNLIPMCFVWLYAAFCGFAPSIVRAATILTIYASNYAFQMKINRLEAFFISLAIVLLAQSSAPFDVGFYLSFLAVAGIATFLPFLQSTMRLQRMKNFKKTIQLFNISLSAQIATTPLILSAFRSFPIIGIIASIPASLLAFPILIGGMGIALLPETTCIASLLAIPLKWASKSLIFISQTADRLNPHILSNIFLPNSVIVLYSCAVIFLAFYTQFRKKILFYVSASTFIGAIILAIL